MLLRFRSPSAPGPRVARGPVEPSTAYLATDLIADQPGVAPITDPTLINAWGISLSPTGGAFWVSSNGGDLSEVYIGDVNGSAIAQPFKVATPGGAPTGQVFNGTGSTTDFLVTDGTNTTPSVFIFASEQGAITGWNPAVGVTGTPRSGTADGGCQGGDAAVYKGLPSRPFQAATSCTQPTFTTARSTLSMGSSTK